VRRGDGAKKRKGNPVRILSGGAANESEEEAADYDVEGAASAEEQDFVLLIPNTFMGAVLGRGGEKIKVGTCKLGLL
jgi:hypothetical protein